MDLRSCCVVHAYHDFRSNIKNFVIINFVHQMLKIHVLPNDANCFKMSICKGR